MIFELALLPRLPFMKTNFHYGFARLHFLIKQLGGLLVFWGTVWFLHLAIYGEDLIPLDYAGISLLVPAAALVEFLAREKRMRSLGGLSRRRLWTLSQREILFVLVAIFGVIVMSKDGRFSRFLLVVFLCGYTFWITWMNLVGHRLLHRVCYFRDENSIAEPRIANRIPAKPNCRTTEN